MRVRADGDAERRPGVPRRCSPTWCGRSSTGPRRHDARAGRRRRRRASPAWPPHTGSAGADPRSTCSCWRRDERPGGKVGASRSAVSSSRRGPTRSWRASHGRSSCAASSASGDDLRPARRGAYAVDRAGLVPFPPGPRRHPGRRRRARPLAGPIAGGAALGRAPTSCRRRADGGRRRVARLAAAAAAGATRRRAALVGAAARRAARRRRGPAERAARRSPSCAPGSGTGSLIRGARAALDAGRPPDARPDVPAAARRGIGPAPATRWPRLGRSASGTATPVDARSSAGRRGSRRWTGGERSPPTPSCLPTPAARPPAAARTSPDAAAGELAAIAYVSTGVVSSSTATARPSALPDGDRVRGAARPGADDRRARCAVRASGPSVVRRRARGALLRRARRATRTCSTRADERHRRGRAPASRGASLPLARTPERAAVVRWPRRCRSTTSVTWSGSPRSRRAARAGIFVTGHAYEASASRTASAARTRPPSGSRASRPPIGDGRDRRDRRRCR